MKLRIGVDGACVYFVLAGVQGIQCIVKLRIGVDGAVFVLCTGWGARYVMQVSSYQLNKYCR